MALVAALYIHHANAEEATVLEAVEVHGSAQDQEQAGSEVKGDELLIKSSSTLGDTLSGELGVNNASFGPGVGLPVLRGLTGSRVRLMQDGIASHDASSVSPDHATSIDASVAEVIEIIRGPAVLEYGGGAIGGIVNVIDNRIPEFLPLEPISGSVAARYGNNGDARETSFTLETGADIVAIHADGFYRDNEFIEIPGESIDRASLTEQFGPDDYVTSTGFIDNSDARTRGGTVGASLIGDDGFIGIAVNRYESDYGLPPGVHVDLGVVQKVRIDAKQNRYDLKGALYDLGDDIPELQVRMAYVDYLHEEFELGNPGTRFDNEAFEAQTILHYVKDSEHTDAQVEGKFGIQILDRDFSALGVEAFVPQSEQQMLGAYVTESITASEWTVEYGARAELLRIKQTDAIDCAGLNTTFQRDESDFNGFSYSGATRWRFKPNASLRLSLSRAQRAPDIQELLSCGPHLSTQTYDLSFNFDGSDSDGLELETFNVLDLGLQWETARTSLQLNVFYKDVDDYIYLRNLSTANNGPFYNIEKRVFQGTCSSLVQCYPLMQYTQQDAVLSGFELEADLLLNEGTEDRWRLIVFSDFVRARLDDGNDVPRMPPMRLGTAVAFEHGANLDAELRLTHGFEQDRPGENETVTDSYNLLNMSMNYTRKQGDTRAIYFLKAQNLLDEDIRNAASFLRNFSPEPGRRLDLGMKLEF